MPGIELLKALLEAGKLASEIVTNLKKKKKAEREKVAAIFEDIGQLLELTYQELMNGNYPGGMCGQIEQYGKEIKTKFQKVLGTAKAEEFGELLIAAHEVERLHSEVGAGEVTTTDLNLLLESSGRFKAAARMLVI